MRPPNRTPIRGKSAYSINGYSSFLETKYNTKRPLRVYATTRTSTAIPKAKVLDQKSRNPGELDVKKETTTGKKRALFKSTNRGDVGHTISSCKA
jgi:hypothetical protein